MEFTDFLKALMTHSEKRKEEVLVGILPKEILTTFRTIRDDVHYTDRLMELRKRQIELEMEQKLKDEFETRLDSLNERLTSAWRSVYNELDLDPSKVYSYDSVSGKVFMEVDSTNQPYSI